MRVVIDARSYGHRHFTGIGRYIEELIRGLERAESDHQFIVALCDLNHDAYDPQVPSFRKVLAPARPYTWAEQVSITPFLRHLEPDLVHFPANFGPLSYRGRRITTIHDLSMIDHPPVLHRGIRGRLDALRSVPARMAMRRGVNASTRVLADSEATARQLRHHYGRRAEPIDVAYPGVGALELEGDRRPPGIPPGPFLLTVGLSYPHKNLNRLLGATALLRRRRPDLSVVIAGREDHAYELLRSEAARLGLGEVAFFPGRVDDAELAWLYRQATAYVFPSLSEGFGLPGLEAMTVGTPVLAARASCLPEVYGDAAAYFDPLDEARMAQDIENALADRAGLERLRKLGPGQASKYTWAQTAQTTLCAYEAALAGSSTGRHSSPR